MLMAVGVSMMRMEFSGGYNLQLAGKPEKTIEKLLDIPDQIAVNAQEIPGLRPSVRVSEGDSVKCGDVLFSHKGDSRIVFVSPMDGKIAEIRRGARRVLIEILIQPNKTQDFGNFSSLDLDKIDEDQVVQALLQTGHWPYLRTFPFHQMADPEHRPKDIYVTTLETEPHCPDLNFVLKGKEEQIACGVRLLKKLTRGRVFMGLAKTDESYPDAFENIEEASPIRTDAIYPAGSPHAQSYHMAPLKKNEENWYINAQDLVAIVNLFKTGHLDPVRVMTVAGTGCTRPRYVEAYQGSSVNALTHGDVTEGSKRFISGGVFKGFTVKQDGFLGFYSHALQVIPEGVKREFLRFMWPGLDKYSFSRVFLSSVFSRSEYDLSTSCQGEERACIQCSHCEDVCPTQILPQFLFKSVLAEDHDQSEELGILDCVECGLCTYVCPSKIEVGQIIKGGLDTIMKES
jgi:Na+-transporting NADH:ubiquinone oxidoreductase subunit A